MLPPLNEFIMDGKHVVLTCRLYLQKDQLPVVMTGGMTPGYLPAFTTMTVQLKAFGTFLRSPQPL